MVGMVAQGCARLGTVPDPFLKYQFDSVQPYPTPQSNLVRQHVVDVLYLGDEPEASGP
jgi:hypothetical protein